MRLLLVVFILALALPLSAKIPIIKFYLNDGKTSQSKIEDISEINFIKSNLSYSMEIFIDGSINTYDVKDINSIEFIDSTILKINLSNSSENISIFEIDSIIFIPNTCTEVVIGTQTWMCRNLDVDHYRNGTPIRHAETNADWQAAGSKGEGAWCYYNNDVNNGTTYGKLYNWYAVNDPRGLAPDDWHIPSDVEWTTLSTYLGGDSIAGGKLKSTTHWRSPNTGATNETGFSALPGGYREFDGRFKSIGANNYLWSSTENSATYPWSRFLHYYYSYLLRLEINKESGFSVRCVKD